LKKRTRSVGSSSGLDWDYRQQMITYMGSQLCHSADNSHRTAMLEEYCVAEVYRRNFLNNRKQRVCCLSYCLK